MKISKLSNDKIDLIEPLWVELNLLHHLQSVHFKAHFQEASFSKRREYFDTKQELAIFVVKVEATIVAYCVASYHQEIGEIDSLYVTEEYRKNDLGKKLTVEALNWLSDFNCKKINVSVSEGNEHVLSFYEQFGFKNRSYTLQIIDS